MPHFRRRSSLACPTIHDSAGDGVNSPYGIRASPRSVRSGELGAEVWLLSGNTYHAGRMVPAMNEFLQHAAEYRRVAEAIEGGCQHLEQRLRRAPDDQGRDQLAQELVRRRLIQSDVAGLVAALEREARSMQSS